MKAIQKGFRLIKNPLWIAILIIGVTGLILSNFHSPALAFDKSLEIDCIEDPVAEGDTFTLHIESVEPNVSDKETMKVLWSTVGQTADESDYSPLDQQEQTSTSSETEASRMGRTLNTTEDSHSEFTEAFKVRADNAATDGEGAGECTIEITDDDGPGAATTWVEGVPANHGEQYTGADSEPTMAGTYHIGETIQIKQKFTEAVRVQRGDISLRLRLGTADDYVERTAAYAGGSDSDTLTFEYQVAAGDMDRDGLVVADSSYGGPGTLVTKADGSAVNTNYLGTSPGITHKVNGGPYVKEIKISSTPAEGETYRMGETIEVSALFDRSVTVNGTSQVRLQIGEGDGSWVDADYSSGSDSDTLLFQYTVQANEVDSDGVAVEPGYVDSEGETHGMAADGAISDTADSYDMDPFHGGLDDQSAHRVDGRPYITDVSISSTPANGVAYRYRETVNVSLTFDQVVSVTGLPSIAVWIGKDGDGQVEMAKYSSGSQTNTLTFVYQVKENDLDDDGISVVERTGFLENGEVRAADGSTLVNDFIPELADQTAHQIDGSPPYVVSASFTSSPASGQVYRQGESIEVSLTFDQAVDVVGRPSIMLNLGETDANRGAIYSSGHGTATLVFAYIVLSSDQDDDGVALPAKESDGIQGPDLVYQAGTNFQVQGKIPGIASQSGHKVDGRPYVTSASVVSTPARKGIYREAETISVSLAFDQLVDVTGIPSIKLGMGDGEVDATYSSGSGSGKLVFSYVVQQADKDADGISLPAQESDGFGGTYTISKAGNGVEGDSAIPGFDDLDGHEVSGRVQVTSVTVSSDPEDDDTYEYKDTIEVSVLFDDEVTVTGPPQLSLDIGGNSRTAVFSEARSASGGTVVSESSDTEEEDPPTGEVLVFTYTVQEGEEDDDGIAITKDSLTLNVATVVGPNGRTAELEHAEVAAGAGHLVGAVPPVIETAATSEDGSTVLLTFSENVYVRPEITTLSAAAGVDVGIYLRTLIDTFVDDQRPYTTAASVSGAVLTLTVDSPVTEGQSVEVAYDNIFSADVSGVIIDNAGNALEAFSEQEATNSSTLADIESPVRPIVSTNKLTIREGESGTYTMKLGSQPDANVTVSLSVSPTGVLTASAEELTFTTSNWNTAQTITLTASMDEDDLNSWHEIVHTSDTEDFVSGHVKVLVQD